MKKIIVFLLIAFAAIGLSSCNLIQVTPKPNPDDTEETQKFTVTFMDGDTILEKKEIEKDHCVEGITAPTKEGYSFKGWSSTKGSYTEFVFSTKITKDIILYTFYEKDILYYSVSFDTAGGSTVASKQVEEGKTLEQPEAPSKEGHIFKGWSSKASAYEPFNFNSPITQDITLYAHYTIIKVKVIYVNEKEEYVTSEVDYGTVLKKPSNPTKENYTFKGWSIQENEYVAYDFSLGLKEDITLYAFYTKNITPIEKPDPDTEYTGYYASMTGHLDETFKDTLHTLLKSTHKTQLSYTPGVWDALKVADQDPNNPENILCLYTGKSIPIANQDKGSAGENLWNREHAWPNSHGFASRDYAAYTDIHHLFASEKNINNTRGNKDFNYVENGSSDAFGNKWNSTYFEPRDEVKGDIARAMFYLVVRYNDPEELVLELSESSTTSSSNKTGQLGVLSVLLEWNLLDPVSEQEKARNEVVYSIQGNRNPFIDHPEWIGYLYPESQPEVPVEEEFSVHFLELGNYYAGDSVYIKAGEYDILIDAGSRASSSTTIKNYINQYCTDGKLEYVIATHAHQDHIAGFVGNSSNPGIFDLYECEVIIDYALKNTTSAISKNYEAKRDQEVALGARHYTAKDCIDGTNGASRVFQLTDTISFEILNQKFYHESTSDENDYSVCLLFHVGEEHLLFTGDLEEAGEKSLVELNELPHCKVFKGGHHGSKTSSNEALLSAITPEVVCVCCCAGSSEYTENVDNMFPTQDFINRVAMYTNRIYVTTLATYEIAVNSKTGIEYPKVNGFTSMNGNIVVSFDKEKEVVVNCSNHDTILKETEWFNSFITLNGVQRRMRTWPENGKQEVPYE